MKDFEHLLLVLDAATNKRGNGWFKWFHSKNEHCRKQFVETLEANLPFNLMDHLDEARLIISCLSHLGRLTDMFGI